MTGPRRTPRSVLALAVVIVLLLAGGVVAAVQIGDEGPQSPQAAVEKLVSAMGDEDLLGVLGSLVPGEREAVESSLQDLAGELRRLEIVSDSFDLGDIDGVDFEFEDLEYATEELRADLATVRIVGGTVSATFDPAEVPVGPFLLDLLGEDARSGEPRVEVAQFGPGNPSDGFVTVNDGGSWYVSPGYALVESLRLDAGLPLPDPAQRLEPLGAASPEEAARTFVQAAAAADVRRVLRFFPPDEARALHDYAPLFLEDLQAAGAALRSVLAVEIRDITTEADRSGSRAFVRLTDPVVDVVMVGQGIAFTVEDGCVEIREIGSAVVERLCPGQEGAGQIEEGAGQLLNLFFPGLESPDVTLERPELGLVVVERDGSWYVSPARTLLDNVTALLRTLDRADLDAYVQFLEDLFASLVGGFLGGGELDPLPPGLQPP